MESVNHPGHYNAGKIEVIEFIEDQGFGPGFWRGNAIKYAARAGKKDPSKQIEDLKKAVWYLNREIEILSALKEGRAITRPNDMNPRQGTEYYVGSWIEIETPDGEGTIVFQPDGSFTELLGVAGEFLFRRI